MVNRENILLIIVIIAFAILAIAQIAAIIYLLATNKKEEYIN
ncbi:hypothetical protein [Polaribacter porphyrae]|nr:hypothetical protein [Polaribacter porphyrae]